MSKGWHIAVEGIDGSGLTTHSKLLVERLAKAGYNAVYFKEPTEGPIGSVIRGFLRAKRPRQDMLALLFAADRVWNYYEARPSISIVKSSGGVAVSDRYKYSSLAYQGLYLGYELVSCINRMVPAADIVVYIDVPVEVALRRLKSRNVRETFENGSFLYKVKKSYEEALRVAEEEGAIVLRVPGVSNGSERSIEDVSNEIFGRVIEILSSRR